MSNIGERLVRSDRQPMLREGTALLIERLWHSRGDLIAALGLVVACMPAASAKANSVSPREAVAGKFDAVNRHALTEIAAFYSNDAVITAPDFCASRGKGDVVRTYQSLFPAISNLSVEIQEYLASGDSVAVRYVVRGFYKGEAVAVPIMNFFTVRNGLIVRDDGVFDTRGRPCQ